MNAELEIIRFGYSRLRNAEYFRHKIETIEAIMQSRIDTNAIANIYEPFETYVEAIDKAMEVISKSVYSESIILAVKKRAALISGLRNLIQSTAKHFNSDVQNAAKELQIVIKHYKGINQQSVESQTSSTLNMLQDLREKSDSLTVIDLSEWLNQLELANNYVSDLLMNRFSEAAAKPTEQVRPLRALCDKQLDLLYKAIEVFAQITESEAYSSCIATVNAINKKYIDTLAQRKGIAKTKQNKDASHEEQHEE